MHHEHHRVYDCQKRLDIPHKPGRLPTHLYIRLDTLAALPNSHILNSHSTGPLIPSRLKAFLFIRIRLYQPASASIIRQGHPLRFSLV